MAYVRLIIICLGLHPFKFVLIVGVYARAWIVCILACMRGYAWCLAGTPGVSVLFVASSVVSCWSQKEQTMQTDALIQTPGTPTKFQLSSLCSEPSPPLPSPLSPPLSAPFSLFIPLLVLVSLSLSSVSLFYFLFLHHFSAYFCLFPHSPLLFLTLSFALPPLVTLYTHSSLFFRFPPFPLPRPLPLTLLVLRRILLVFSSSSHFRLFLLCVIESRPRD